RDDFICHETAQIIQGREIPPRGFEGGFGLPLLNHRRKSWESLIDALEDTLQFRVSVIAFDDVGAGDYWSNSSEPAFGLLGIPLINQQIYNELASFDSVEPSKGHGRTSGCELVQMLTDSLTEPPRCLVVLSVNVTEPPLTELLVSSPWRWFTGFTLQLDIVAFTSCLEEAGGVFKFQHPSPQHTFDSEQGRVLRLTSRTTETTARLDRFLIG